MSRDCAEFVKKCEKCQINSTIQKLPSTELIPVASPCPFVQWGLDIVGSLPPALGNRKFLFVALDYFTKGVEAEATKKIN